MVQDQCRIISSSMLHKVSKGSSSRTATELRIRRSQSFKEKMLSFIGQNKRLLNIHEQKFAELAAFQANKTMFQANTNASLKNLETRVGLLALSIQNQSTDCFPSDTKKNPKDCMEITLRSGRELQKRKEEENDKTEKEEKEETGKESDQNNSELTEDRREFMV